MNLTRFEDYVRLTGHAPSEPPITLWRVNGLASGYLFPSLIQAVKARLIHFRDDTPAQAQARISVANYVKEP